jgi:hypothetical protein
MNCNEFQRQLERAVESRGPTANEVAAFARHLERCTSPQCAERWADHERLTVATRQWQQSVPVVDLVNRVVNELRRQPSIPAADRHAVALRATYGTVRTPATSAPRRSNSRPSRRPWPIFATAAAAVLLMTSLLTLTRPPATDVAIIVPPPQTVPRDAEPVASPVSERSRSYASMPLSATEFMTDAVALVVPADLSEPGEEPSRADVWADRLGQRLEPIGRELSNTFETLLHVVPKTSS